MSIEDINDKAGNLLGFIETQPDGSQVLKGADGQVKGYYEAAGDHTRDAQQNIVAKGNQLRSMIC